MQFSLAQSVKPTRSFSQLKGIICICHWFDRLNLALSNWISSLWGILEVFFYINLAKVQEHTCAIHSLLFFSWTMHPGPALITSSVLTKLSSVIITMMTAVMSAKKWISIDYVKSRTWHQHDLSPILDICSSITRINTLPHLRQAVLS